MHHQEFSRNLMQTWTNCWLHLVVNPGGTSHRPRHDDDLRSEFFETGQMIVFAHVRVFEKVQMIDFAHMQTSDRTNCWYCVSSGIFTMYIQFPEEKYCFNGGSGHNGCTLSIESIRAPSRTAASPKIRNGPGNLG